MEKWKQIPGFEGKYVISNYGKAMALKGYYRPNEKRLKPELDRYGYHRYTLKTANGPKHFLAHRLVMLAFVGKSDLTVNHKDGNKLNNHPSNLEYVSVEENVEHAHKTGLINLHKSRKDTMTDDERMQVLALRGKMRPTHIAEKFGVCFQTIYNIWGGCTERIDVGSTRRNKKKLSLSENCS